MIYKSNCDMIGSGLVKMGFLLFQLGQINFFWQNEEWVMAESCRKFSRVNQDVDCNFNNIVFAIIIMFSVFINFIQNWAIPSTMSEQLRRNDKV